MRTGSNRVPAKAFAWLSAVCLLLLSGCATGPRPKVERSFAFEHDTFAFANGLVWEYGTDADGRWTSRRREPPPDYSHHCFVIARSARQFFAHARFAPELPRIDEAAYRELVRRVIQRSPRTVSPPAERVAIPGFKDLREFSGSFESLLKSECGGAWQSYVQRGHWRMLLPFSRNHQAEICTQIQESVKDGQPVVAHLVRFPQLTINHAIVIFDAHRTASGWEFTVYDPNEPGHPVLLEFEDRSRTFLMPRNSYFAGGRVDVYEVYHRWLY